MDVHMQIFVFLPEERKLAQKILDSRKVPRIDTELWSRKFHTYPRSLDFVQGDVPFREIQLTNRYCREGQGDDHV
jgi:hypothetical protein